MGLTPNTTESAPNNQDEAPLSESAFVQFPKNSSPIQSDNVYFPTDHLTPFKVALAAGSFATKQLQL